MPATSSTSGRWVTIHGNAVFIGGDGEIKKGPKALVGKKLEGESRTDRKAFASDEEAHDFATENIAKGRATEAAVYALIQYQDRDFEEVNSALRNEADLAELELAEKVDLIDEAIAASEIDEPVTLYRGQGVEHEQIEQLKALAESGEAFVDPAFLSTTLQPEVAEDFASGAKTSVIFEIDAKPGQSALYMNAWTGTSYKSGVGTELEVLLPRNTLLKIDSIEPDAGKAGRFRVRLSVA